MAVSGADWRKSTDELRTRGAHRASLVRSSFGGVSAAFEPPISGGSPDAARTLADNTDSGGIAAVLNPVETDDHTVPEPLAIGGTKGMVVVTECPGDERAACADDDAHTRRRPSGHDLDGDEIYLDYFTPGSGTRPRAVIVE